MSLIGEKTSINICADTYPIGLLFQLWVDWKTLSPERKDHVLCENNLKSNLHLVQLNRYKSLPIGFFVPNIQVSLYFPILLTSKQTFAPWPPTLEKCSQYKVTKGGGEQFTTKHIRVKFQGQHLLLELSIETHIWVTILKLWFKMIF